MAPPSKTPGKTPGNSPENPATSEQAQDAEPMNRARRRLLSMAVYLPPTVLGIISLQQAGCQPTPSCNPINCNPATAPCSPDDNPCSPNTGCNPDFCNPNN